MAPKYMYPDNAVDSGTLHAAAKSMSFVRFSSRMDVCQKTCVRIHEDIIPQKKHSELQAYRDGSWRGSLMMATALIGAAPTMGQTGNKATPSMAHVAV